jgi:hypothetical protein
LPSVPGLSSRLIVNSFAVGMLGNLLQLCLGNAGRAFLGNRKIPGFEWKNASDGSFVILDRWGRVGKGELGDYSCDMHCAFTSFPQGRTGVTHSFASLICGLDNFHCDVLVQFPARCAEYRPEGFG